MQIDGVGGHGLINKAHYVKPCYLIYYYLYTWYETLRVLYMSIKIESTLPTCFIFEKVHSYSIYVRSLCLNVF